MRTFSILFLITIILLGCKKKENKSKYYFSSLNQRIARVEENKIVLYNIKDSTEISLKIDDHGNLIKLGKNESFDYKLSEDSLLIFDDAEILSEKRLIKLKRFVNKFDNDLDSTYWNFPNSSLSYITVFLDKGSFISYDENDKIIETGNYELSNDFNSYNLFFPNSAITFSDSYYIISKATEDTLVLIDVNTSKNYYFNRYFNQTDSLVFGNWNRLTPKLNNSLANLYNYNFCVGDNLMIKKDLIISSIKEDNKIENYRYTFGLNSRTLFIDDCTILEVVKATKDSLILYNPDIIVSEYRTLKYVRDNSSE